MIAENLRKSNLLSGFKSTAQIERRETLGLVIAGIAGSIVLRLAICVLLASFVGFNQSEASNFNLFRETPLRDVRENSTYDLVWQSEPTSIKSYVIDILPVVGRVPAKYSSNRCNHIAHLPSENAKFLNFSSSPVIGNCSITFTSASVCIYLLIDVPPPYSRA